MNCILGLYSISHSHVHTCMNMRMRERIQAKYTLHAYNIVSFKLSMIKYEGLLLDCIFLFNMISTQHYALSGEYRRTRKTSVGLYSSVHFHVNTTIFSLQENIKEYEKLLLFSQLLV